MYMAQMLCLVVSGVGARGMDAAARDAFDEALRGVGFVHFASLAMLPPPPDTDRPAELMIELVLDEGVDPREGVRRVATAAMAPLRGLLVDHGPFDDPRAMLDHLEAAAVPARAAGGFVGMRDRAAEEVHRELLWYQFARVQLAGLVRDAAAAGPAPASDELVRRLLPRLAAHPFWRSMQQAPARSFWRREGLGPLRMVAALAWVILPLPLFACVLAAVGWLVASLAGLLPGTTAPLGAGAVASLVLLLLTALAASSLVVAVAQSVLILLAAMAGFFVFHAVLAVGFMRIPEGAVALWSGPAAWAVGIAAAAGSVLLWVLLLQRRPGPRAFADHWLALAGLLLSTWVLGAAWRGTLALPQPRFDDLAPFVIPGLVGALLLRCNEQARWYFAISLPFLLLLLVGTALSWHWLQGPAEALPGAVDAARLVGVGVLSLLDMAVLAAIGLSFAALACLRAPRAPLGAPLVAGAAVLGALHLALASGISYGLGPSSPARDPSQTLADPWTFVCTALAVMAVALLLAAVGWLARRARAALKAGVEQLDARRWNEPFVPHRVHRSVVEAEADLFDQPSHMISLTDFRGGRWAWPLYGMAAWIFLHVIGTAGRLLYAQGWLGQAWGIKFGHWHIVQGGRRLLFVSNFDGDFGGYLDEFIRGASQGINLIWRWTHLRAREPAAGGQPGVERPRRFPETWCLGFAGCHHEQAFKAYARASMLPHLYLFQRYALSNQDIVRVRELREALVGPRTPENDERIVRILQS